MYFIPAGLFANGLGTYADALTKAFPKDAVASLTWGAFFVKNLIPVTLGNIVGGSVMTGLSYWFIYARPDKAELAGTGKK
jgi:formate/nitrite transporter FocA (FNT family)